MNTKDNIEFTSPARSICLAAIEDLRGHIFDEAAHSILFMVLAFEYDKNCIDLLLLEINRLSLAEFEAFHIELMYRIKWANNVKNSDVFNTDEKTKQNKRLQQFNQMLIDNFMKRGEKYIKQSKVEISIDHLKRASGLKLFDQEIMKLFDPISQAIKDKIRKLIYRLNNLESKEHLLCKTLPLGIIQKAEEKNNIYSMGDQIIISIEAPKHKDGYFFILNYDDKSHLRFIFPSKSTDNNSIKASETKRVVTSTSFLSEQQYIKVIWSSDRIVVPEKINFEDEYDQLDTMESFLCKISDVDENEWMESICELRILQNT
jgi:hypothetical protein